MTCNGCREHVEDALSKVEGVHQANVDLEKESAKLDLDESVELDELKRAVSESGNYALHDKDAQAAAPKIIKVKDVGPGIYYCPMHCEGDKTYDGPNNCPVCGMDLVKQATATDEEDETYKKLLRKFWLSVIFTLPVFIIAMSDMIPGKPLLKLMDAYSWNWVQFGLSLPVVFYTCWMFFQRAYSSIIRRSLNMFTLIGIGAGVAWIFSVVALLLPDFFPAQFKTDSGVVHVYFEAATVILTLVLLGQLLEARAHNRTNSAIKMLLKMAPNEATRIVNGTEEVVPIEDIQLGDILKVKPGEKIPVDGVLINGNATIDESMITGEPVPVDKAISDKLSAGTVNGTTVFEMRAEKVGADTLLSQIIHMVNTASRSQAPVQKLADKISSYFVPIIIGISILTFIAWVVFGPEPVYAYALVNAIAVLIIACPCALGLATPMSVMVGIGKGAQLGVLIKDAETLEKLNKIDTLIIDKTGTVTEGKPSVEKISDDSLIALVASVNSNSEHPLAKATVQYAAEKQIAHFEVSDFNTIVGKGVEAISDGKKVFIGNKKLMDDQLVIFPVDILKNAAEEQARGKTVPFIAINGKVEGFIVLSDAIKTTSKRAIKDLESAGLDIIMMTGDNQHTASYVASELGINEFVANCLPEDKLKEVETLQLAGKVVAMAGDGINDAPALALADVGIAMGTGTDVAMESGDITLVKGDLRGILKAKKLGSAVMQNIRQNLFFALVYNGLGVPLAAGILYPFMHMLLSPMVAAVAMSFSSVSVIANALRLKRLKL